MNTLLDGILEQKSGIRQKQRKFEWSMNISYQMINMDLLFVTNISY